MTYNVSDFYNLIKFSPDMPLARIANEELVKNKVVHYQEIDLAKLLRITVEDFNGSTKERRINFKVKCPGTLLAQVDPDKIQRVLLNLLSNAFKFVPEGGDINCVLQAHYDKATISVFHSGSGIPEESREATYERVYQLVEPHHGRVLVNDAPGGGTLFTVTIPVFAPQAAKINRPSLHDSQRNYSNTPILELSSSSIVKPSILIVEDNSEMHELISNVLAGDFNIISAKNGCEGLQKALELKPDLILTDVVMPNMSGDHMIHEIRQHRKLNDIPIILLSSKTDDALCLKLLREGAQDYVKKPVSQEELKIRITNLVNLKKAKNEISQRIDELMVANEELDAFSRSVSHDLRNPVNAICGFSSILLKHTNLDANQKDFLNEIYFSARKMENLIDNLLILSQAARHEINHETINISSIVKTIVKSLRKLHPNRNVQFSIQDDVSISGDAHLIHIAFENLIHNAWKYTSKTTQAHIEFAAMDNKTFYVKDNGVGFPSTKAHKLFTPFTRLHSENDFPGTGIGLTTVKRIIDRHGGRVWAESDSSNGATFYVALPHS